MYVIYVYMYVSTVICVCMYCDICMNVYTVIYVIMCVIYVCMYCDM